MKIVSIKNWLISFTVLCSLLLSHQAKSQTYLSDSASISLITCDPGEELYSVFGHTAIRVSDPVQNIDIVYNYGIFDFNTPHFYWKFARGKLRYMIGENHFDQFMYMYILENRSVYEQNLLLSHVELIQLYSFLQWNNQPENRYYMYDFLFNNCSTKVIEVIRKLFGNKYFSNEFDTQLTEVTFRQAIGTHLKNKKWEKFGIDLALGVPVDKLMTREQSTFLPLVLMNEISNTGVKPLAEEPHLIFKSTPTKTEKQLFTPMGIAWLIFLLYLIISVLQYFTLRKYPFADIILFSIIGIIGFVVFFMWFFTDHSSTHGNFNLWWAFPLHFPFIILYYATKRNWLRYYFLFNFVSLVVLILVWKVIPQHYNAAFFPLVLALLLRSFMLAFPVFKRVR